MQILGTVKGIACDPDQDAQPCLGHPPHICPRNGSVDHSLPGCPSPLLLITHRSDSLALLFRLYNSCSLSFSAALDYILSAVALPKLALVGCYNLLVFQAIDSLVYCLHHIPFKFCPNLALGPGFRQTGQVILLV